MKKLIIYHGGCADGFLAAHLASRKFGRSEVELCAAAYQEPPPETRGRGVYLLDFSYKREVLTKIIQVAASVTIFDHHKTAEEDLRGLNELKNVRMIFDMGRSGAGITWDEFYPGQDRPWLVNYAEDRDLWRFKLSKSKPVNAAIQMTPKTEEAYARLFNDGVDATYQRGLGCELALKDYVAYAKTLARVGRIAGERDVVPVVNAGSWGVSELVGELAEESEVGYAVGWSVTSIGSISYSLRARKNGVDVSAIAKRFGGGGHASAAGFKTLGPLPVIDFV